MYVSIQQYIFENYIELRYKLKQSIFENYIELKY